MRNNCQGSITGTQVSYAHVCDRKLWLYTKGVTMEIFSESVEQGRVMHMHGYPRKTKEVQVPEAGVVLDFCAKDGTIHEVKLSPRLEQAHIMQLAYYMYLFYKHDQKISHGVIHYPKIRKTQKVTLTQELLAELEITLEKVETITQQLAIPENFPSRRLCKKCAYYEFCFS